MERRRKSAQKPKPSSEVPPVEEVTSASNKPVERKLPSYEGVKRTSLQAAFGWISLLTLFMNSSWITYHVQFLRMPPPLTASEAGKRGFSEVTAMKHVKALTQIGPRPVGSEALDRAVQYVLSEVQKIEANGNWDAELEVDYFHSKEGANRLKEGLFKGKTLLYGGLKHVVVRITPKRSLEAVDNAILVSSHIDTVFSAEGAGDCSSCVAVMLELSRAVSHWAGGFRHAVIFLFNTGEEDGLNGAHSFVTQHPWNSTIKLAIDLEAMGVGGKSSLFQAGPDPWIVEAFARVAKHPCAQTLAQDIFNSGIIKSGTDFQVYREVAGLSGLDFAYLENGAVYHTKNDKMGFLRPGSLQHLGDNILALLVEVVASPQLKNIQAKPIHEFPKEPAIVFFDILGKYMITYSSKLAYSFYISVVLQSLLIWGVSLFQGGVKALTSLSLSCLGILCMWILALSLSSLVAFILPHLCSSPLPFIAHPLLLVGLFVAPALVGALLGHHIGYLSLVKFLRTSETKTVQSSNEDPSSRKQFDHIKWEAQRWLFKAGFVQWIYILILCMWAKIGSAYIALIWLVSPAVSYGLFEATLSPLREPKELKTASLILGLLSPLVLTGGVFISLIRILAGMMVRFDRNPGENPEWFGTLIIALLVAASVCLLLVYHFPYAHSSGGLKWIIMGTTGFFLVTLGAVSFNMIPPFTSDVGRALNVVQIVNVTKSGENHYQSESYISLSSLTSGKLIHELQELKDANFICSNENHLDFVTYSVKYGCVSKVDVIGELEKSNFPEIKIESDMSNDVQRRTAISVDTKASKRWAMAINTVEIRSLKIEFISTSGKRETLVPEDEIVGIDGWHILQFVTHGNGPNLFHLTLSWNHNRKVPVSFKDQLNNNRNNLIKLRTDMDVITPKLAYVLDRLPEWCTLFGKSTSTLTLSYISTLGVDN